MKHNIFVLSCVIIALVLAFVFKSKNEATELASGDYVNIDLSVFKNGAEIFITPHELHKRLRDENLVILDGNHPKVYAKGHISGAISIGFKGLSDCNGKPGDKGWGTVLKIEALTKKLESLGIDNDTLVVTYSDVLKGPGAGGRAAWQLKMAGLKNVRLLYGGMNVWKKAGYELTKDISEPIPSTGLILNDFDEVYQIKKDVIYSQIARLKLVDVRSEEEFSGADTSRGEKRGGHIKNAKWLEWTDLLNDDSTPKSPEEITNLMAKAGIKPEDDFALY